jgi:hypothetical protein
MARLQTEPSVVAVESRTPSLEEIFVAYMQAENPSSARDAGSEQAQPQSAET